MAPQAGISIMEDSRIFFFLVPPFYICILQIKKKKSKPF